MSVHDEVNKR